MKKICTGLYLILSFFAAIHARAQGNMSDVFWHYLNPIAFETPKAGQFIYCHTIYFEKDGTALLPASYPSLDSIAIAIRRYPRLKIEISSHVNCKCFHACDTLTRLRAQNVMNYLIYRGCEPGSLYAKGYGSTKPIYTCANCGISSPQGQSNCSQDQFSINERSEFRITGIRPEQDVSPIDTLNPRIGQFFMSRNIYYNLDKSDLKWESFPAVDSMLTFVKALPCFTFEIGSFTDCRASVAHNDSLSKDRARYIQSYFVSKGCDIKRLSIRGYGEDILLNNCQCEPNNVGPGRDCTEQEHAENRRTELRVAGIVPDCKYQPDTDGGYRIDTGRLLNGQYIFPENIRFKKGTAEFYKESCNTLDSLAFVFQRNPRWLLQVAGNTDSVGSLYQKDSLSRVRADVIIQYLYKRGCRPYSLVPYGYGDNVLVLKTPRFRLLKIDPRRNVYPIDTLHPAIGQFAQIDVYWDLDHTGLVPKSQFQLDSLGAILKRHPELTFEIGSFTDCRASFNHNDSLSLARSKYLREYYVHYGISKEHITVKGYGERQLLNHCQCAPNNTGPGKDCTEAEHAFNRRTEIKIIGLKHK